MRAAQRGDGGEGVNQIAQRAQPHDEQPRHGPSPVPAGPARRESSDRVE
jgi:hypothetical protein